MIKRESYMKQIRPFIGGDLIKVLTGIRRSGKSVMLELIQAELIASGIRPEQFISLNFEKMENAGLCSADVLHREILARASTITGKAYLFFDEIQEVSDWEKCVNSLRVTLDCDIYLTGSNAKLLSGELATYLGGRYVEFVIYPFSFAEFSELYAEVFPDSSLHQRFQSYLTVGGMPYLSNLRYEREPCQRYLEDLYNSVVLKDVVKRNSVRDVQLLERIIAYVMANTGNVFSASSVSKFLKNERRKVSTDTVLNYIKYGIDAYMIYRARREDLRGKQILSTSEKYYIADHGLREAVFGGNMRDINLVLENIVFMELLRRGYQVTVGKAGDREIDFIGAKQGEKRYVQVAYLLASEDTVQREFGVYEGLRDNFPKYVISMDEFDFSRNGIRHMNIRDFLLQEQWN